MQTDPAESREATEARETAAALAATALVAAALAICLMAYAWVLTRPANAHEAPSGWSYDRTCCSDYDCRLIADDAVAVTSGGWLVKATGEVLPFNDRRVKPSPDGSFHRCSHAFARPEAPDKTICLYAPGFGS